MSLTTGVDNITGTNGNDTINGYINSTAASTDSTLTAADTVNGGQGSDTFNITTVGNVAIADATAGAQVSNIETVNIRAVGTGGVTLSAANVAGATTINSKLSTDAVTITNMAAGATIGVIGNGAVTNGATNYAYAVAGSSNIAISGGTTAGNITNTGASSATNTITSTGANNTVGTIDLGTGTSVTSLTINATTALSASLAADYAANAKLTLTGSATNTNTATGLPSAAVDLSGAALSANIVTVDASGLTAGGASVQVGANTTTFTGGAGNDTVNIAGLVYNSTGKLNAGAGTADVLVMNDAAALTAVTAANISGFEVLSLTADADATLDTFNMSLLSGLTHLVLNADAGSGGYSVTNMSAAQAGNVQITGNLATTPTFGITGATTVGQMDVLSIKIDDNLTAKNTLTVANVTAAGVETLNVNAVDNATISSLTGMSAMTAMNVTGGGNVNITTGALAANVNTVIDATAVTGTVTISAAAATTNGVSIKGTTSSKVNTLTGSAQADVIVGGAGNDVITGGAGNDTLTGGAGSDQFVMLTATIASGNDTITDFTTGVGGDAIDLGYLTIPASLTAVAMTQSATIATNAIYTVNYGGAIGTTDFTVAGATGFDKLFGAGKALGTTVATTDDFMVIVQGTDKTVILAFENPAATTLANTDIDAVVTLSGVTSANAFDIANFM